MSTDKENAKNGAMEVEETSNDETPDTQASSDAKVSDESTGKSKEKDVKKKSKGKEPKKESKESDSNSVKESKTVKVVKEEESEDDEENEENEKSGDVPLLDQPLELSGTRERKKVQRFSEEYKTEQKDAGPIEIPKGRGVRLGSIPRVEANIQRSKPDVLRPVHKVLFNRVGKSAIWRKNIFKFNGFDFDEESDFYAKKKQSLLKFDMKFLKGFCSLLDLKSPPKRDEIVETILKFLMNPEDSGKPLSKPRPKRAARANNKSYSESDEEEERKSSRRGAKKRASLKEISSEDEDDNDLEGVDQDEKKHKVEENDKDDVKVRKGRERKGNNADKDAKENDSDDGGNDDDDDDDDDDDENAKNEEDEGSSDDSEKLKSKSKKGSRSTKNNNMRQSAKKANSKKTASKKPEKKPASKKRAKSDDESSEDEPLAKKSKAPPTDEEIKTYVKEILEGANLEETTMKIVCKQVYAHYPEFDLAHKKDFIKTTVKSLIST